MNTVILIEIMKVYFYTLYGHLKFNKSIIYHLSSHDQANKQKLALQSSVVACFV